jgi:hypothetical protein
MKNYLLPEDVRASILGYLMQRPYQEVALGVRMVEGLKEIGTVAPEPAPAPVPELELATG